MNKYDLLCIDIKNLENRFRLRQYPSFRFRREIDNIASDLEWSHDYLLIDDVQYKDLREMLLQLVQSYYPKSI